MQVPNNLLQSAMFKSFPTFHAFLVDFQYFFGSDILPGLRLFGFSTIFRRSNSTSPTCLGGNVEFHSGQLVYLFFYLVHSGRKMS